MTVTKQRDLIGVPIESSDVVLNPLKHGQNVHQGLVSLGGAVASVQKS